jgi:hypothetical protein
MDTVNAARTLACVVLGLRGACAASPENGPHSPQSVIPRTDMEFGMTSEQAVADADVVDRISTARCGCRRASERIGPGGYYLDHDDCMSQMRTLVSDQLNASRCPGGIGEVGVSRCVSSLLTGECDIPGQVDSTAGHCKLDSMCLK